MSLTNLHLEDLLLVNRGVQSYKITIEDFSSELGIDLTTGDLVVDNDLHVNGNAIIGDPNNLCVSRLDIYNNTQINCTLTVVGASVFENTIEVQNAATFRSNADVEGELTVSQNAFVTEGVKTTDSVVSTSFVMSSVGATDNTIVPSSYRGRPWKFGSVAGGVSPELNSVEIEGAAGNAYFKGEVHAAFFEGDGSRLINLNLPGSLNFKGVINAVKDNSPANPGFGDYYLNTDPIAGDANGTPKSGQWGTLGAVEEGNFIYYAEVTAGAGDWVKASGDETAYVTIAGGQTITGAKKFSEVIVAESGVDATGSFVNTNNLRFVDGVGSRLDLTFKATSMLTVGSDSDNTLVTKDYVDYIAENGQTKFDLVAGAHLVDSNGLFNARFNGTEEVTLSVDATSAPDFNKIVLRDGTGSINATDVNAVGGNVNVINGNIAVSGGIGGNGKITATGDITSTQTLVSNKLDTGEVQANTYNIHTLASIGAAPTP